MSDEHKVSPPKKASTLFYLAAAVSAAVVLGLLAGLIRVRGARLEQQEGSLERELAAGRRVVVTPVLQAESARSVDIPATMHGYIETPVYAKIAGYLETINVDKGDRVKKDQVMATLISPELDQQVANARASRPSGGWRGAVTSAAPGPATSARLSGPPKLGDRK